MEKKRALLSVYDKTDIVKLGRFLEQNGFEIISTGGTKRELISAGIQCRDVSDITGFPEMMDGRLKTLHPMIFGGILADLSKEDHKTAMKDHNMSKINVVTVNFYPFHKVLEEGLPPEKAIELIDIGGPSMVRAAAKNHKYTAVLTSPKQYEDFMKSCRENSGFPSYEKLKKYAADAFAATRAYDSMIASYFSTAEFPTTTAIEMKLVQKMRYGENPHQKAAAYAVVSEKNTLFNFEQLQGKELSFNNLSDLDGLLRILRSFPHYPTCAVVKHANPCGIGESETSLKEAFARAHECDPVSAFGGIFGFNRPLEPSIAEKLAKLFCEVIAAPDFPEESLKILSKKKKVRLLKIDPSLLEPRKTGIEWRPVDGGMLAQTIDPSLHASLAEAECVTKVKPTEKQIAALDFANRACQHVKSNAIVIGRPHCTVGIGAGQMSRVDACKIAIEKAGKRTEGAVLASDAFFPFRDSIDMCAEAGIKCIVQPGGSIRDKEVIEAADEHGIAMLFTGIRHFRH